jgi:hypothetical protein
MLTVRLSEPQHERYERFGGHLWLRAQIDAA